MTAFTTWLRQHAHRNDPVGDVARDHVEDSCAPEGGPALLRGHITRKHHACDGALDALNEAELEWAREFNLHLSCSICTVSYAAGGFLHEGDFCEGDTHKGDPCEGQLVIGATS